MATIDGSIVLISLPDIFRGIGIDPLLPGNSFYLLWMILGFLVTTSVLVVTLGRLGDMYGRVRIYNLGFAVFTFFSLALSVTWLTGDRRRHVPHRHAHLPGRRGGHADGQLGRHPHRRLPRAPAGHGPRREPGRRLQRLVHRADPRRHPGPDQLAAHLLGVGAHRPLRHRLGLPAAARARAAPLGPHRLVGQRHLRPRPGLRHGRHHLRDRALRRPRHGLDQSTGASARWSRASLLLVAFCIIEVHVREPMFRLQLFKIRAFTAGVFASFLAAISRGGLMFMLIIWLQGIWLPLHGYSFATTPLWAGIALIPLTVGMLIAGPVSGVLSDRFGAAPLRHRRHDRRGHLLRAARGPADRLLLLGVRRHPVLHRPHHGVVRLAQPHRRHEQPAARAPRCRLGHEHHLPELGAGRSPSASSSR